MVYHLNVGAGMSNTIEVKQVPSHMVWNDHGTGSNGDFSCWNPDITDGYSMLGSIPHGNYNQPSTVFVLKGTLDSLLDMYRYVLTRIES